MISFWIRETFASIKKAQASFILAVISTSIAVSLVLSSILIFYLTEEFDRNIREDMSLNLFLEEKVDEPEREKINLELENKKYIRSYDYVTKEQAAENFIAETGEDFRKLIDYNPLPASYEVYLQKDYVHRDSIRKIQSELEKIEGIEEVYFSAEVYYRIMDYLAKSKNYVIGLTIVLLFLSMYLVYSTNRLILHQRFDELNTMKLIGASLFSIKMPVILNSIVIGLTAGLLSLLLLFLFYRYMNIIPEISSELIRIIVLSGALAGPVLGITTSYFSLRRISLKI